jgi:D-aminopeptidase
MSPSVAFELEDVGRRRGEQRGALARPGQRKSWGHDGHEGTTDTTDCTKAFLRVRHSFVAVVLQALALLLLLADALGAQQSPRSRAREMGFSALIAGVPGPLDAITDVAGVEVGHTTLVSGSGRLVVGKGPVRTGVTVVHPRGKASADPVFGAWFTLNGNGEMTGTTWLQESGILEGPVAITNTHSVGVVRDAILQWQVKRPGLQPWGLPVVAETWDGALNDINGFHVTSAHTIAALDGATTGAVAEGNVGGGTGMVCHGFKGGIGTASRRLPVAQGGYTVGVLVQCNYGTRAALRVAGVPVGEEIADLLPCVASADPALQPNRPRCAPATPGASGTPRDDADAGAGQGSIIIVVATDAPLLPHQLKRVATRAALGVGRVGGRGENSSGDIFAAFSTANPRTASDTGTARVEMLPNARINPLFAATIQATEEAILNAMLAAETMTGADELRVFALPRDRLLAAMRKYGREPKP